MNPNIEEYHSENPFGLETESDFHATRRNMTLSIIRKQIENRESTKVLDVGCGKGLITKLIEKEFPEVFIDAIDISTVAIQQAKSVASRINFSVNDAIDFRGFGYKYDVILLNNIYEHLENPVGVLVNLKEILSTDGVFVISTPNRYNTRNVLKKLFGMRISIPKYHITEYSIGQLYDHHLYAGLRVKEIVLPKFKREKFKLSSYLIFSFVEPVFNTYFRFLNSKTRTGSLLFVISSKNS
jgi:SAM-dependent methyltransferase